jgi:hypothetical protein
MLTGYMYIATTNKYEKGNSFSTSHIVVNSILEFGFVTKYNSEWLQTSLEINHILAFYRKHQTLVSK